MQAAHSASNWDALRCSAAVRALLPVAAVVVEGPVVPMLATDGDFEPPQPAARSASPATPAPIEHRT
jgi:hypothetical protein